MEARINNKKGSRGFTLIELLAVITIIGILMFVGIPAITKIIFNSRKKTVSISAAQYVSEVNKEIKSHEIGVGEVDDGKYSIMKNGNVCLVTYDKDSDQCSGQALEIEMEGKQIPSGGEIEIFGKQVVQIKNVEVDSFYVNSYNRENYVATLEPVEIKPVLCRTKGDINYDIGTLYTCEVADGEKHDFRILSTQGDTYNLMMTKNYGSPTAWYDDNEDHNGSNFNGCGPMSAYSKIQDLTSGWNKLRNIDFSYSVSDFRINITDGSGLIRSKHPDCYEEMRDYYQMKARLATQSEISTLGVAYSEENTVDPNVGYCDSCGYWLTDQFTGGGDYTASAVAAPHGSVEEVMWGLGVRPVIQVSKADLG